MKHDEATLPPALVVQVERGVRPQRTEWREIADALKLEYGEKHASHYSFKRHAYVGRAGALLLKAERMEASLPRWVPVREALPPEHVTCAVRMGGDYIATAWAVYWHGARTDFARWVFPHDSDADCEDKITHWLALPPVVGLGA